MTGLLGLLLLHHQRLCSLSRIEPTDSVIRFLKRRSTFRVLIDFAVVQVHHHARTERLLARAFQRLFMLRRC